MTGDLARSEAQLKKSTVCGVGRAVETVPATESFQFAAGRVFRLFRNPFRDRTKVNHRPERWLRGGGLR